MAPKYSSIHAYAVFILLTPMRLFLYTGKYANLIEKTKVICHVVFNFELCTFPGVFRSVYVFCANVWLAHFSVVYGVGISVRRYKIENMEVIFVELLVAILWTEKEIF